MRIVAFCPIKLKNRRLPGKNTRNLGGKPLMNHSIETIHNSGIFDDIYVFCSDENIVSLIPPGVRFLKRDKLLDRDQTTGKEIYSAFAQKVDADYYFLFHVTSPFLTFASINRAISAVKQDFDSALSVSKVKTFGWHRGEAINFDKSNPIQTQLLNPIYLETSSFFLAPKTAFIEGIRYGDKPCLVEVDERESIDIDYPEDWEKAEKYL